MSDEKDDDDQQDKSSDKGDGRVTDAETSFEEYSSDKECPECGSPVIDVRANCPNCGYEYKESDYGDTEAGSEFVAGSAVDEEGNEVPDDATGGGEDEDGTDGDDEPDEDASND